MALLGAVRLGDLSKFEAELGKKDVNQQGSDGKTALMAAVSTASDNRANFVNALVKKKAKLNITDKLGRNVLHHIKEGKDDIKILNLLLNEKADITDMKDYHGWSPLMFHISNGNYKIAVQLIKRGANIDDADEDGYSVLMMASEAGTENVVDELLRRKVDVNVHDNRGNRALHLAITNGRVSSTLKTDVAKKLIEYGADITDMDKEGNTALHLAVVANNNDVIQVLLQRGADVDRKNLNGNTPRKLLEDQQKGIAKTMKTLENLPRKQNPSTSVNTAPSGEQNTTTHTGSSDDTPKWRNDMPKGKINNPYNHLQNMMGDFNKTLRKSMNELAANVLDLGNILKNEPDQLSKALARINELEKMVRGMVNNTEKQSRELQGAVNLIIRNSEDIYSGMCQDDWYNEYVNYECFYVVAQAFGQQPGSWVGLCEKMFEGYPPFFMQDLMQSLQSKHGKMEQDIVYEMLTRWKVYKHSYIDKIHLLKLIISDEDLGFEDAEEVCDEIDDIIYKFTKDAKEIPRGSLTDSSLEELAEMLTNEWKQLAECLGFNKTHIEERGQKKSAQVRGLLLCCKSGETWRMDIKKSSWQDLLKL